MKKKILSLLFIIILILSAVTGCSENTTKDNEKDGSIDFNKLEPVELVIYAVGEEKSDTDEVLDSIEEASKLNIDIVVKWYRDYMLMADAINEAILTGAKIDGFYCGGPHDGGLDIFNLTEKDLVLDLETLLPRHAPTLYSRVSQEAINDASIDGKLVFIPSTFSMTTIPSVFMRADLAERYNVTEIRTLNDYTDLLEKIRTDIADDEVPGAFRGYNLYDLRLLAPEFGYEVLDENLQLVYKKEGHSIIVEAWEETDAFRESLSMIDYWITNELIADTFGDENLLTWLGMTDNIYESAYDIDVNGNGEYQSYVNFAIQKESKYRRYQQMDLGPAMSMSISSSSENPERLLMLIDWIHSSQENYDLFMYGVKDKQYTLENERIAPLDGGNINNGGYMNSFRNLAFWDIQYQRTTIGDNSPETFKEDYIYFIENHTEYARHSGFVPDYSSVEEIAAGRKALLSELIVNPIRTRKIDTSDLDNIIASLKKEHTDEIINEIQEQIDKWMSEYDSE